MYTVCTVHLCFCTVLAVGLFAQMWLVLWIDAVSLCRQYNRRNTCSEKAVPHPQHMYTGIVLMGQNSTCTYVHTYVGIISPDLTFSTSPLYFYCMSACTILYTLHCMFVCTFVCFRQCTLCKQCDWDPTSSLLQPPQT